MATCCVMVEPPCTTWPALKLAKAARDDAERIDAVVLEEAVVLGGDEGLHHVLAGSDRSGKHDALLQVELADELALRRKDATGTRRLVVGERAPAVGQIFFELFVTPVPEAGAERATDEEEQDEETDEARSACAFLPCFFVPSAGRFNLPVSSGLDTIIG